MECLVGHLYRKTCKCGKQGDLITGEVERQWELEVERPVEKLLRVPNNDHCQNFFYGSLISALLVHSQPVFEGYVSSYASGNAVESSNQNITGLNKKLWQKEGGMLGRLERHCQPLVNHWLGDGGRGNARSC